MRISTRAPRLRRNPPPVNADALPAAPSRGAGLFGTSEPVQLIDEALEARKRLVLFNNAMPLPLRTVRQHALNLPPLPQHTLKLAPGADGVAVCP